jgi:oligoribonuclease (3'-5' exoribonuclease)
MSLFSSESPAGGVVPKPDISSGIASQLTLQRKDIKAVTALAVHYIHVYINYISTPNCGNIIQNMKYILNKMMWYNKGIIHLRKLSPEKHTKNLGWKT